MTLLPPKKGAFAAPRVIVPGLSGLPAVGRARVDDFLIQRAGVADHRWKISLAVRLTENSSSPHTRTTADALADSAFGIKFLPLDRHFH
jgi:hypothetical protein